MSSLFLPGTLEHAYLDNSGSIVFEGERHIYMPNSGRDVSLWIAAAVGDMSNLPVEFFPGGIVLQGQSVEAALHTGIQGFREAVQTLVGPHTAFGILKAYDDKGCGSIAHIVPPDEVLQWTGAGIRYLPFYQRLDHHIFLSTKQVPIVDVSSTERVAMTTASYLSTPKLVTCQFALFEPRGARESTDLVLIAVNVQPVTDQLQGKVYKLARKLLSFYK